MNKRLHVVNKQVQTIDNFFHIKRYDFNTFPKDCDPAEFLGQGFAKVLDEAKEHGSLGVAFLYGYQGVGEKFQGIDLRIYRDFGNQGLPLRMSDNPMIHTWTLEKSADTQFRELDRSMDGTNCLREDIIGGQESLILMELIKRGSFGESLVQKYTSRWPEKHLK